MNRLIRGKGLTFSRLGWNTLTFTDFKWYSLQSSLQLCIVSTGTSFQVSALPAVKLVEEVSLWLKKNNL